MSTDELPRFVTLRSNLSGACVRYRDQPASAVGLVDMLGTDVFDPYSKIEIERAQSNRNFVHLRFCYSNRYWARRKEPGDAFEYISATSMEPEEDTSKMSCTLFEPRIRSDERGPWYNFTHVQNRGGVRVDSNGFLYVLGNNIFQIFRPFDWEATVILPKLVTFRGYNDKYLRSTEIMGREFLQFSSDDPNEEATGYEVTVNPQGFILIRSRFFRRFWRRNSNSNWIWADSTDNSGDNKDTLFWAIKVDDNTIVLRNVGNDRFCSSMTDGAQMRDCLSSGVSTLSREARLVVQELVLAREISDVRYRLEDSRIYDEELFIAGRGTADNQTNHEATLAITVTYEESHSYSFTNSLSLSAGIEMSIRAGIPLIVKKQITISASVSRSFEWNTTTEETKSSSATYTANVPPWSRVTVNYIGIKGKCNVPFSYNQRDRLATDGSSVTTRHVDGIHMGVNSYDYYFENHKTSRL